MSNSNISTMADHLRQCADFLSSSQAQTCKDIRVIARLKEQVFAQQRLFNNRQSPGSHCMPEYNTPPPHNLPSGAQMSIAHFTDRTSVAQQESSDSDLAKWMFHCKIPHSTVDEPYFKKFVNGLKKSYKVPGRTKVSTTLLKKEYATLQAELLTAIDGASSVTMTLDGWCKSQVGAGLRCCSILCIGLQQACGQ